MHMKLLSQKDFAIKTLFGGKEEKLKRVSFPGRWYSSSWLLNEEKRNMISDSKWLLAALLFVRLTLCKKK